MRPFRRTTPSSSLISARIVQGRLQEYSVPTSLMDLTEENVSVRHMSALQSMTLPSRTRWLRSIRQRLQIHSENILPKNHMKQARIAETEKYAHVTFFFNGGVEEPNEGEDRILVKSPKVATYDLKPEMSAYEVCDKLVEAIRSLKYDVIIINFANPDMVGHTGVEAAAVKAIEAVDECVGRTVDAIKEVDGQMFICADHGNAEQLIDETTGEPFTAHTTNQVPFIIVNADPSYGLREGGCLADIAPTLIEMMGMKSRKR